MGFGILFVGYFLFLNVTYPGFTDLISGLLILYSFYKLVPINKYFRMSIIPAVVFSVFGLFELVVELMAMVGVNISEISIYLAAPRFIITGIISITMLMGLWEVASEVDVPETKGRVKVARPLTYIAFPLCAILEFPVITNIIPDGLPIAIVSTLSLLFVFIVTIYNLTAIYSAYMRICMPDDVDHDVKVKPSRFGFVNKFREHEAEKQREYQEYKLNRFKKKNDKRGKKK